MNPSRTRRRMTEDIVGAAVAWQIGASAQPRLQRSPVNQSRHDPASAGASRWEHR
jgi:hypothetical protein